MKFPAPPPAKIAIVVVAAGRGSRAGDGAPKQYRQVAGLTVLAHSLNALGRAAPDAIIAPVIHADDFDLYSEAIAGLDPAARGQLTAPVWGGATRQDSVRAGLEALAADPTNRPNIVLIHDAARIFASETLIMRAIEAAREYGAAIPGIAVTDTIKEIDVEACIAATPPRARLRAVQTPQAFDFSLILDAHRKAAAAGAADLTDDAAIAEWAGHRVFVFKGDADNMKITSAEDLAAAEGRLIRDLADIRTGQGYDVHAFGAGDHIWLGGVEMSHDHGLVGHSDADVLSHAVTDALLGALADGDIGSHFPPSDPQWRGAASKIFLAAAAARVRARGGMIAHIDATVVCERPKIGPHRDAIRASLAAIVGVSLDRVAVKATTSERLGFTGREEGIAAFAIATVRLPL
ncbi:2C-methyl-D-erythritol 2,4-cyclodiphosphate synthase [Methylocella silvestris BL2]|uniref:Bifunctional enzyme IspD/IspF n=1 Tax=Methylocella silvestris (strain DSM 15510 / CIP 108128 / LMG 27833 / NCIMB 13906 / BL2) TaxID=395965 RepID=B8EJU4_METSB|nr:bifunctional 2-C-methyl-D-erythritol 4-phosphate cytidylyltransferase/2-C-methyl-D-erythritol 2,4-cyclodiphosphate synthase [Methylocella silvestris]ACK49498.1 2C-methyl-D-erythritol 2,4-cyclodiphosphate synthase [Methylocella silvestris BL2]